MAGFAAAAETGGNEDACRASTPYEDRLDAVGPRGELVLASGRRGVLVDLHWPEDGTQSQVASDWLMTQRGTPLTVTPRGTPDRWGRVGIDAVTAAELPVDLADGLIGAGLAMAESGERGSVCRPDRLELEDAPRREARGVWASPIVEARDGDKLTTIEGDFIVARGRVLSVGERPKRTYLNFVRKGGSGLTVTVSKRTWRIMQDHGLSAATLKGRLVRVRGRVEVWHGPVLDIQSADLVERLEEGQAQER